MKRPNARLDRVVDKYFKDAELILHAGDIVSPELLDAFRDKPVRAVSGNWDDNQLRSALPEKLSIEVNGFKIGLIHGWGAPFGLYKRLESRFHGVDCIVFGHSHWTMNAVRDGVLFFNPGTFRGDVFSLWRKTIGILWVSTNIKGEIIRL